MIMINASMSMHCILKTILTGLFPSIKLEERLVPTGVDLTRIIPKGISQTKLVLSGIPPTGVFLEKM